jgi:hypothetical protein
MRISIPAVVFALLLAVLAVNPAAAEVDVELRETTPQLTEQVTAPTAQMNLDVVQVPSVTERLAADQPAAAAQPTRTSWWWLVGAIVVAGVIIAVLVN